MSAIHKFFIFSFVFLSLALAVSAGSWCYQETAPVERYLDIGGSSTTFLLTEKLMTVTPVDDAPVSCIAVTLGSLYFDISENQFCQCISTGWAEMDDAGAACT